MAEATELAADYLIGSSFDWPEPQRNEVTGDGVLCHPHGGQSKIMNHVFRGKLDNNWSIHRRVQLADHDDVVLSRRIIWVEAEWIRIRDQFDIAAAELSVWSGQMKIPVKLLPDHVDQDGIFRVRKLIHAFCPEGNGKTNQQDRLNQNNREFEVC